MGILPGQKNNLGPADVCRKHGIAIATFHESTINTSLYHFLM